MIKNVTLSSEWNNYQSKIIKSGNIAILLFNAAVKNDNSYTALGTIATLPDDFLPISEITNNVLTNNGEVAQMIIAENGDIKFNRNISTGGVGVRALVSYVV